MAGSGVSVGPYLQDSASAIDELRGPSKGGVAFLPLKKRADFLAAARGFRWHGPSFGLQALKRSGNQSPPQLPRCGLTVTKRVGGAVERNRIKRRLRAALRQPGLAGEPGRDYVIVAKRSSLSVSFADLVAELATSLRATRKEGKPGRSKPGRSRRPGSGPSSTC